METKQNHLLIGVRHNGKYIRLCSDSYEFLEWTQTVTYPYFVGEYNEFEPILENNEEEKTFILTGFCRGKDARLNLEKMRGKIEKEFNPVTGKIATLNSGSVVAIFYFIGKFDFCRTLK